MGAVDFRYDPIRREELCEWCDGTGVNHHRHGPAYPCPDCEGTGLVSASDGEAEEDDFAESDEPIKEAVPSAPLAHPIFPNHTALMSTTTTPPPTTTVAPAAGSYESVLEGGHHTIRSSGGDLIAILPDASPHSEARARLLSAAPDLLEALRYIMDWTGAPWDTDEACRRARHAVARAEGRP